MIDLADALKAERPGFIGRQRIEAPLGDKRGAAKRAFTMQGLASSRGLGRGGRSGGARRGDGQPQRCRGRTPRALSFTSRSRRARRYSTRKPRRRNSPKPCRAQSQRRTAAIAARRRRARYGRRHRLDHQTNPGGRREPARRRRSVGGGHRLGVGLHCAGGYPAGAGSCACSRPGQDRTGRSLCRRCRRPHSASISAAA